MVTGGYESGTGALSSVELWRADGSHCNLPSLPGGRSRHTQSRLLLCGSYHTSGTNTRNTCSKFSEGSWTTSHTLLSGRSNHLAWSSHPDGVLLIGGRNPPHGEFFKSTELVSTSNSSTTVLFTLDSTIM